MCSPLRTCTPAQVPSVIYNVTGEFFLSVLSEQGDPPPPPYVFFLTLVTAPLILPVDLSNSSVVAVRADLKPIYASLNILNDVPAAKFYFSNYVIEKSHINTSVNPDVPTTWTADTAPVNKCFLDNLTGIVTDTDIGNIFDKLTIKATIPITLPLEVIVVKRAL